MVTMSDDAKKKIAEDPVKSGTHSQSEVVRDAIRQLAVKYGSKAGTKEEVRRIIVEDITF